MEMTKKAGGIATGNDVFCVDKLRELMELMKEYDLSELELMQDDREIRLARGGRAVAAAPSVVAASAPIGPSVAVVAPAASAADGPHIKVIHSPMVGTFYDKPKPGADAFVKVGSKVTADTVVCIVEAMKVFNEIPAEISGTIVEVLVKHEEAVDFNRPLFKVDTRG